MSSNIWGGRSQRTPAERTRAVLTSSKRAKIKELIGKCEYCNQQMEIHRLKIHHIDEAANADGSSDKNTPSNLIVICSYCHDDYHVGNKITKTSFKEKVKKRSVHTKTELKSILKDRPLVIDEPNNPFSPKLPAMFSPPAPPKAKRKPKKKTWSRGKTKPPTNPYEFRLF